MNITEEQKRMIDKVTKLLSLADSTNHVAERETAKQMAAELMAKYNITLSDKKDTIFNIVNEDLDEYNSHEHHITLMNALGKFNGVFVIVIRHEDYRKTLRYIGSEASLINFNYMREIVELQRNTAYLKQMEDPKYAMDFRVPSQRNQWFLGYSYGVQAKLIELMKMRDQKIQEWGLVPVKEHEKAEDWYRKNVPNNLRKGRAPNSKFLSSGYQAGKQVSLNRAVPGNGSTGGIKALK